MFKLKTIAALLLFVSVFGFAALKTPALAEPAPVPAPDPKMPPMPSMEAPDSNDLTKPAGATKSVAVPKTKGAPKATPAKPAAAKSAATKSIAPTKSAAPDVGPGKTTPVKAGKPSLPRTGATGGFQRRATGRKGLKAPSIGKRTASPGGRVRSARPVPKGRKR